MGREEERQETEKDERDREREESGEEGERQRGRREIEERDRERTCTDKETLNQHSGVLPPVSNMLFHHGNNAHKCDSLGGKMSPTDYLTLPPEPRLPSTKGALRPYPGEMWNSSR